MCGRGRTFKRHPFKIPTILHSTGNLSRRRITTNIPLNPLMPTILLDNPSLARRLMPLLGAGSILRNCSLYQSLSPRIRRVFQVAKTWGSMIKISPHLRANRIFGCLLPSYFLISFPPDRYSRPHSVRVPSLVVSRIFRMLMDTGENKNTAETSREMCRPQHVLALCSMYFRSATDRYSIKFLLSNRVIYFPPESFQHIRIPLARCQRESSSSISVSSFYHPRYFLSKI